jgi:hypothetical protein
MIVIVIVMGILIGWGVGNYFLDRWINDNHKDINKDGGKNHSVK